MRRRMIKTLRGTVDEFSLYKAGMGKNDKPYKLYEVIVGETKFKTFDESYGELLGIESELVYKEEEGQGEHGPYTSRTLLPRQKSGTTPSAPTAPQPSPGDQMHGLKGISDEALQAVLKNTKEINHKLDTVLGALIDKAGKSMDEADKDDGTISIHDIPGIDG